MTAMGQGISGLGESFMPGTTAPALPAGERRTSLPATEHGQNAAAAHAARRLQIVVSPYYGRPDFSVLDADRVADAALDRISVADLLRNGFVYAPHSIFREVKVVTSGFDPAHDMHAAPEFRFMFRESGRTVADDAPDQDWVETYHRLLCAALSSACEHIRAPWLLQSGGKDSTPLAIAAAEVRPDTRCITYLGGNEENEVESARLVASQLGLQHHVLVCDPGRAYDRYLACVGRMPLLTGDFALLSYVDLATEVAGQGGDGVVDGMGADSYFGPAVEHRYRMLSWLARGLRLPAWATELPLLDRSFRLCYALATLQLDPLERAFPGSRFTDAEVDALLGDTVAARSHARLAVFRPEIDSAGNADERWAMANSISGVASFAKGLYTAHALSLQAAYPFCDRTLREWVYRQVPAHQRVDPVTRANKVLVRRHIAARFRELPYVARKGSFRFDLCGLARQRYEQVYAFAEQARELLPGAPAWLRRNRGRLGNKYHASKFYLLAVVLPWLLHRSAGDPARWSDA